MLRQTKSGLLSLILLLAFVGWSCTVHAQQAREIADTGVVSLGPNQVLRVQVAAGDVNGDGVALRFRRIGYQPKSIVSGVAVQTIGTQNTTPVITLSSGEVASVDISRNFLSGVFQDVRAMVITNDRNVKVTAEIVDMTTGNIIGVLVAL